MSPPSCRDCGRPLTVIPDGFGEAYSCPRCDKPAAPTRCTCAGIADEYAPCPVHEPAAPSSYDLALREWQGGAPGAARPGQPAAPTRATWHGKPTVVWPGIPNLHEPATPCACEHPEDGDALEQVRFGFELARRGLK